ncbi:transposable element Tcb2 transposase [Trichonephila clavipes]|nr:transposable element Tcb2 transposase [Trichonephila clavipes]
METGWSARRVARQLGSSDCVPTASLAAIQDQVAPSLGAPASSRTIRSRLAEKHLGSGCQLCVLPLTPNHRRLRLEWCRARGNKTAAEWNQDVFSDESRFNLSSDDNHVRVCKCHGECFNPAFSLQRHTAPKVDVMVWGAIADNRRSPLVLILCTMIAQRYVHEVLQPHVLLLMQRLPGIVFQQDNVPQECHKTVSALFLPFVGLPDPQICLQSSISRFISNRGLGILGF